MNTFHIREQEIVKGLTKDIFRNKVKVIETLLLINNDQYREFYIVTNAYSCYCTL